MMSHTKRNLDEHLETFDPFSSKDFEPDEFVESMGRGAHEPAQRRAAWQRLEEHSDIRRLRAELEDWDDFT